MDVSHNQGYWRLRLHHGRWQGGHRVSLAWIIKDRHYDAIIKALVKHDLDMVVAVWYDRKPLWVPIEPCQTNGIAIVPPASDRNFWIFFSPNSIFSLPANRDWVLVDPWRAGHSSHPVQPKYLDGLPRALFGTISMKQSLSGNLWCGKGCHFESVPKTLRGFMRCITTVYGGGEDMAREGPVWGLFWLSSAYRKAWLLAARSREPLPLVGHILFATL